MKDPLFQRQTAYEILGVGQDVNDQGINKAFRDALLRTNDQRALQSARQELLQPNVRFMLDILYYDPAFLSKLSPSPVDNPSILELPHRGKTAQLWTMQLKKNPNQEGFVHSLAVLWHHWALYEEEQLSAMLKSLQEMGDNLSGVKSKQEILYRLSQKKFDDCTPSVASCQHHDCPWYADCQLSAPTIDRLWRNSLGYWAALINLSDFWREKGGISNNWLVEMVGNELTHLKQKYNEFGIDYLSRLWDELSLIFRIEKAAGKEMEEVGVRIGSEGTVLIGGPVFLNSLGLEGQVRSAINEGIKHSPENSHLRRLCQYHSPFAMIAELVEQNRFGDALASIAKLSDAQQKDPEIQRLTSKALGERAQYYATQNKFEEAIKDWGKALPTTGSKEERAEITGKMVDRVMDRATILRQKHEDDAIELLEKAKKVVNDNNLNALLADLLCSRSISRLNKIIERITKKENEPCCGEDIQQAEKALSDLERSAALNNPTANTQLEAARQVLEAMKRGDIYFEAPGVNELRSKASVAASREEWDTAIAYLRQAIGLYRDAVPSGLKKNLAICLANEAYVSMNRVSSGGIRHKEKVHTFKKAKEGLSEASQLDPFNGSIKSSLHHCETELSQLLSKSKRRRVIAIIGVIIFLILLAFFYL